MKNQYQCSLVGNGSLLITCATLLLERGHTIKHVVSQNEAIIEWGQAQNVATFRRLDELEAALQAEPVDYLFSIANLSIIPDEILALPRQGSINFHDGPLPRYAGLYATSWALLNDEQEHGVTWHEMLAAVDTGVIYKQRRFAVSADETAFTLNARCYDIGVDTFGELLDDLEKGPLPRIEQDFSQKTYFSKYQRPPAAQVISLNSPAEAIDSLVRALNFGSQYENPLGMPKLKIGQRWVLVPQVEVLDEQSGALPGTVLETSPESITAATATQDIRLTQLLALDGEPIPLTEFAGIAGWQISDLDPTSAQRLTDLHDTVVRNERFWARRLAQLEPVEIPYVNRTRTDAPTFETHSLSVPDFNFNTDEIAQADFLAAVFSLYLARITETETHFDVGFQSVPDHAEFRGFEALYGELVPLRVKLDKTITANAALQTLLEQVAKTQSRGTYVRDVVARFPELKKLSAPNGQPVYPVTIEIVADVDKYKPNSDSELTLVIAADGSQWQLVYRQPVFDTERVAALGQGILTFIDNVMADPDVPLGQVSLHTAAELEHLLVTLNATAADYPAVCIHDEIATQAAQRPEDIAVVFEDQALTYQQLNAQANQLGQHLRELGVGPDVPVGLYAERSLDLMIGLLGILKAGGAYLPLDPTYPEDRIAFMVENAQVPVLVTQRKLVDQLPPHQAQVVCVDDDSYRAQPTTDFDSGVQPHNLSYIIYTSGSTGLPKGVMIEHRNVINFFAGMDNDIHHDPPGAWLAVTSLSFDISVLELLWTLTRGFKVVLYADSMKTQQYAHADKNIDFSLYYFASDEGEHAEDKYQLLIEGAKFADKNSFYAVWTPERHFHAFGGLYPNPSVASAALAMVTDNVKLLAGSCVSPLHSPIRIAEEWSLVDNLSKGRVGISFAAGWQPNDFVLKPETFADRKNQMFRDIEDVQQLWQGHTLTFPGATGNDVEVRTLPRPVQATLPVWITAAGNPETFRLAGEKGYNLLTHLLGQTPQEVGEKIAIYRQARRDAGHDGPGHVTIMLHTFVGDDYDVVRELVREPMKDYLRSSVGLIKAAAWSFPTFKQKAEATGKNPMEVFESEDLTDEDLEALLDHAFERYFETSGLFGTIETCLDIVDEMKAIDIDEIACLIDYGVATDTVLEQLHNLNRVRELSNLGGDFSLAGQVKRHNVTHLQCTPSMADMMLESPENREALGNLKQMFVGGEAFPPTLAATLREIVPGDVLNMYGPTETTIWSATHKLNGETDSIPLGRPITNTSIYILDSNLQPTPVGVPGELYIGGHGVVRGYLHRPELTAERFVTDPFIPDARMYRTGDLARWGTDGKLEFLGRVDHQVKLRGYRIELGEIEARLNEHPTVEKAVVIAREDVPGDKRLVAYLIPNSGQAINAATLRDFLKERLPEFMVPSHFLPIAAFPLTPNAKIDRKALPSPAEAQQFAPPVTATAVPAQNETETRVTQIWCEILNVPQVGLNENFFDLGGHSLLAVRLHRQLCDAFELDLAITDIFRFPTVKSLAAHISDKQQPASTDDKKLSRAERRAQMRLQRQRR